MRFSAFFCNTRGFHHSFTIRYSVPWDTFIDVFTVKAIWTMIGIAVTLHKAAAVFAFEVFFLSDKVFFMIVHWLVWQKNLLDNTIEHHFVLVGVIVFDIIRGLYV